MTKNGAKIRSNRPKIGLKSVCVRSQQQSGRWIPKKYGPPLFFSHILGPSGRFEAPLWAHLPPNGGPRRSKWRPNSTKKRCQKSMRKRCRKTMEKEANLEGVREVKTRRPSALRSRPPCWGEFSPPPTPLHWGTLGPNDPKK